MTTTTIDSHGNRSDEPEDRKIFEKITDTIKELKSSGVSQNSRIENAIEKLSAVNVNSAENAKYAINSAVVKTSNGTHLFLQILLFLIAVAIGYFSLDKILNLTNKLTLALGSNYYQTSTLGSISIVIAVLILANLLLFLFPFFQTETKNKIIKFETYTLVFLILSLVSFNALGGQSFISNYTPEEQSKIIAEGIEKETVSVWDKIGCYITFNQECISEKLTTNTAETTVRSTYSLSAEKIPPQSKSLEQWKARPITINYKIASSGDLKIERIECYQEKIDSNHMLSNKSFENKIINTDGQITDLPGISCNLENLKVTGSKTTEDITIIPVLYMTINTTYTLKLPVLSEKLYTESTGEKGPISYLDYKTIDYMKKKNIAFEVKQTNNALNFALKGTQNSFPLVYGNSDTLKFDIPIEISENPSNPLGKIENTRLLEKPTVSEYFTYDNKESEDIFSKSSDGTKLYYNLYLTENENIAEKIDLPIIIANIDIKTESTIKKEDMSTRFKITVRDIQVTNQTTTTNTQNNSNYDTLIQKYISLKQTIQEPYPENIQYKINDIENLISLINTYNNRELTTDEITTRNAYIYGLNVNINELDTLIKQTPSSITQTENYIAPDP